MTKLLPPLALCLLLIGCSTPPADSPEGRLVGAAVDNLCAATGLQRSGPVSKVQSWPKGGATVTVPLSCDGKVRSFAIQLDHHARLVSFGPAALNLAGLRQGLGIDNVTDSSARAICLGTVARFNARCGWEFYTMPAIQQLGENYVVTYQTVPQTSQNWSQALNAGVSYLITPRGTVFAVILGI